MGLSASCSYQASASGTSFFFVPINLSGGVTATLESDTYVDIDVDFITENILTHEPHDVNVDTCDAHLGLDIDITINELPSIVGDFANDLADEVLDFIGDALKTMLCEVFRSGVLDEMLLGVYSDVRDTLLGKWEG